MLLYNLLFRVVMAQMIYYLVASLVINIVLGRKSRFVRLTQTDRPGAVWLDPLKAHL